MREYVTVQGDTFESVAHFQMGDSRYMTALLRANRPYTDTAVFSAGTTLTLPDVPPQAKDDNVPPWRRT